MILMDNKQVDKLELVGTDGSIVTKTLTESGTITTPTATKTIKANGNNIDVLNYAKVNVDVPSDSDSPEWDIEYTFDVPNDVTSTTVTNIKNVTDSELDGAITKILGTKGSEQHYVKALVMECVYNGEASDTGVKYTRKIGILTKDGTENAAGTMAMNAINLLNNGTVLDYATSFGIGLTLHTINYVLMIHGRMISDGRLAVKAGNYTLRIKATDVVGQVV